MKGGGDCLWQKKIYDLFLKKWAYIIDVFRKLRLSGIRAGIKFLLSCKLNQGGSKMKRIIVVTVALAFVLLSAGAALAAPISGSKHDMRSWMGVVTGGYDEVCVYCHTPHGASPAAPLWNHSLTVATHNIYSAAVSSSMNATPTGPGAGSLLCLSCHDGTVAVDSMVNTPNAGTKTLTYTIASGNSAYMGTDLTNDHPIGFDYNAALVAADGQLVADTIVTNISTTARLINGKVECASCHNAHDSANAPFLRTSNVNSQLCTFCHIK